MIRCDRLLTVYVSYPLRRWMGGGNGTKVPILMYHSVSEGDEAGTHPYYRVTVTPSVFAEHIAWLHENDYRTVSLSQAISATKGTDAEGKKVVGLTFDDGYMDFYTNACPLLEQYGFSATVFLPTAYIGRRVRQFKGRDCLTWREVAELSKRGFVFGSHTVNHPELRALSRDRVTEELRCSREVIEDRLGVTVDSFSYPYSFPDGDTDFSRLFRELLEGCGYKQGVTTIIGTVSGKDDPFLLKRLPVNSEDDDVFFRAKLIGAYDWLRFPQRLSKRVKSKLRKTRFRTET